jgi:N-acyl-D-aspartate/D-glutamate deacylase
MAVGSDGGPPFAFSWVGNLSRLAVWWLKLAVRPERIVVGKPPQNGCHERVHRALKQRTAAPTRRRISISWARATVIGTSDGGGRPHTADRNKTSTQLLGYWVREQQAMPLGEVLYRLTGTTALMLDMHDRGFIAAGRVADVTIFDPDTIAPKRREPVTSLPAGGVQVKREAVGIDKVIVNGTVLFENGEVTGALLGQIIRGPLYQGAQA